MTFPRRQLEREDLVTSIEQGRRVERGLFRENTRGMDTLGNLLTNRQFSKREDVRKWEQRRDWNARVQQVGDDVLSASHQFVRHGVACPCDGCHEAVKRLLRACGVLPSGPPDRARVTAEPVIERLRVPMRYRRDESDR